MTLARALRAWTAPIAQVRRPHDGIRGIVAKRRFCRGDLLLSVPLSYCYFPHASRDPRRMRRWNRAALFPEAQQWLRRLSPDAEEECVALSASVTTEDDKVLTLNLTPVEAALAVSVALRYFWLEVVMLKDSKGIGRPLLGPSRFRPADLYLQSLPLERFLSYGLEGPYMSALEDEANLHSAIEQVAWNLRDCVLSHAPQEEYRFYDAHPSELDAALLAAIYVIRARLLRVTAIHVEENVPESLTSVLAPIVDFLNHSAWDYTCVACVALRRRAVVVRAFRDIDVGEELTLDYRGPMEQRQGNRGKTGGALALEEEDDWWESRYLISADEA
ncbi:hypothetical protein DQ04_00021130 [Trypanosoma grayi]|uniref:hypothetical protein n=1 Tax=Trypanosoma grayi TaxID=71804 RepID=UPI0004F4535E|nr:hypothetical protein DQ04_00021130 [Trypanosoma grayi]KEG15615.1 hypothetical protein DQ04_00021130 [Trypanosoma grayi]